MPVFCVTSKKSRELLLAFYFFAVLTTMVRARKNQKMAKSSKFIVETNPQEFWESVQK